MLDAAYAALPGNVLCDEHYGNFSAEVERRKARSQPRALCLGQFAFSYELESLDRLSYAAIYLCMTVKLYKNRRHGYRLPLAEQRMLQDAAFLIQADETVRFLKRQGFYFKTTRADLGRLKERRTQWSFLIIS